MQADTTVAIVDRAYRLGRVLLDLFYPPFCVGCGQVGTVYCPSCLQAAPRIQPPLCPRCGRPQASSRVCQGCVRDPTPADGIRSVAAFEGSVRSAIHQFKYSYVRDLAAPLGEMLVSYWRGMPIEVDVIVPVPLHVRRLRERGYNQSALLAQHLGAALRIPTDAGCLRRNRYTVSQTRLNAQERSRNVEGAFACERGVDGKCVLLVDDVCTTGATLDACCRALQEGGAASVWALTVARAVPALDP